MITTEQLKQLAPIVCPQNCHSGKPMWKSLWIAFAHSEADLNPPVIADKAALNAAFGIGETK